MTQTDMTPSEQVSAMVRMGVPREKAERTVRGEQRHPLAAPPIADDDLIVHANRPIEFPIRVVVPWSLLVSDNDKYGAVIVHRSGKPTPRLLLTSRYKGAKESVRKLAREAMTVDGYLHTPMRQALQLAAKVYVPDNRPGHDVANFAKLIHDACEKAIYVNDAQLHRVTWERAGVDVDRPRAELAIGQIGGWLER